MVQPIERESIDSFSGAIHPSRTQHTTLLVLRSPSVLVPPFVLIMAKITPMRRKKKVRLIDPPGPTLDTLRSFFKPAPISSQEIDK
jgi:hypothetical protein